MTYYYFRKLISNFNILSPCEGGKCWLNTLHFSRLIYFCLASIWTDQSVGCLQSTLHAPRSERPEILSQTALQTFGQAFPISSHCRTLPTILWEKQVGLRGGDVVMWKKKKTDRQTDRQTANTTTNAKTHSDVCTETDIHSNETKWWPNETKRKNAHLFRLKARWDPGVFLQRTAAVVVRGGVALCVLHQALQRAVRLRHARHLMHFRCALAVPTHLPAAEGQYLSSVLCGWRWTCLSCKLRTLTDKLCKGVCEVFRKFVVLGRACWTVDHFGQICLQIQR